MPPLLLALASLPMYPLVFYILPFAALLLSLGMILLLLVRYSEMQLLETNEEEVKKELAKMDNLICARVNEEDLQEMQMIVEELFCQRTTDVIRRVMSHLEEYISQESCSFRRCESSKAAAQGSSNEFASKSSNEFTHNFDRTRSTDFSSSVLQQQCSFPKITNHELRCSPSIQDPPRPHEHCGCSPVSNSEISYREYRHSDVGLGGIDFWREIDCGSAQGVTRSKSFTNGSRQRKCSSSRRGSKPSSGSKFYANVIANRTAQSHYSSSFYL
eukprot:754860-Hanusia_phi.AAC.2